MQKKEIETSFLLYKKNLFTEAKISGNGLRVVFMQIPCTEGPEAARRLPLAQDSMAWKGLQEIIRSNQQCSGSYVMGMHYVRWLCPSTVRALLFHTLFSL